ncbi:MAG: hypothetical protein WD934_08950 [Gemmatimonadales bacterium]
MIRVALVGLALVLPGGQGANQVPTIIRALELPSLASAARDAGVPPVQVESVLAGLHQRGLPAGEAALILRQEVDALAAGSARGRFGTFVQVHLEAGLRGRALAEAIRDEHAAPRPQPSGRRP